VAAARAPRGLEVALHVSGNLNMKGSPHDYFEDMIDHCCDYAKELKDCGRPIVGIMCEFTPREVILAAGAVPVCLCGGSLETIAAAEADLPANLCPLIKSTYGYHAQGSNPFLEWADLIVAETTCDGKKKMFELMSESRPMHILELPQKPDDPDALAHWTGEVGKLRSALEKRFRVRITGPKLRAAIRLMNRERGLRRELAGLMSLERPPLTGRQLLDFKSLISGIEADLDQYERAARLYREGAATPGSPLAHRGGPPPVRVLMTGVPMVHGAERVIELVEGQGAVVVAQENCTGLKPILEDIDAEAVDPLRAIAEKYLHLPCPVMMANGRRLESLAALAAKFRPQCVIELVWHACLTYDVESFLVRRFVEDELGLSYLKIDTDYSASDSGRLALRVGALFETVRARAGTPGPWEAR
jgi:benzoyl-CoA reductase/2-hydroxyglutaryl-CoA dehydratase subunit BcrC/BadD/HgdB